MTVRLRSTLFVLLSVGLAAPRCWPRDRCSRNLWGINLYPGVEGADWLEFDSMINLRPSFGNRSRGLDDPATREAIVNLVQRLVQP